MSDAAAADSVAGVDTVAPSLLDSDDTNHGEQGEVAVVSETSAQGPSKRALKKAAKRERTANMWKEKRQAAKLKKRERAAERKTEAATGPLSPETAAEAAAEQEKKLLLRRLRTEEERDAYAKRCEVGQRVVVDLDFYDKMTDRERASMALQVNQAYGVNRRCATPLKSVPGPLLPVLRARDPLHDNRLYLTGINEEMFKIFRKRDGFDQWQLTSTADSYDKMFDKSELVYLTADSPNIITELDPSKVYIVGGIVDKNRHKGLCKAKADVEGIATARLPIDEHIKMLACRVLTTNHVLHILSNFCETKDWRQSLLTVIPMRKSDPEFLAAKHARKRQRGDSEPAAGDSEAHSSDEPQDDDDKGAE